MENPFKKLVGLKGVSPDNSAVSWVNELPGLTTELVDALTRDDEEQASDVWNRTQAAALDRLESELFNCLTASNTFVSLLSRMVEPEPLDGLLEPADHYVGVLLSVPPMTNTHIRMLNLAVMSNNDDDVASILIVRNHSWDIELLQKIVTVVPGINVISIDLTYELKLMEKPELFVGLSADELVLTNLSMPQWESDLINYKVQPAFFFGGVLTTGLSTCNVYLEVEHKRSLTSVIPRFADQLRLAYLYLCGSLLMTEKLASTNFNLFTNTNRDFTIEQEEKLMRDAKAAIKPVARLIEQHLQQKGSLTPASDTESGYSMGSFV